MERRDKAERADKGESCRWGLECENGEVAVVGVGDEE